MAYRRPPAPFDRRTNPPRRPTDLNRQALQPTDPSRHGPLSPPTPYPPTASSAQSVESSHSFVSDRMDIDSPLPQPSPVPNDPRSLRPTARAPGVHRHTFEVDIANREGGMPDHEILQYARTQLGFLERSGLAEGSMRSIRNCRMRLRVRIDTKSASRIDALVDVKMRMLAMLDMISDGMGWFTGLPWKHEHFAVEVVYC